MRLPSSICCLVVVLCVLSPAWPDRAARGEGSTWKAGIDRAKITPERPTWMSGYAPRLASKKIHDIWVKVLALEAADGRRGVIITADVCGFSKLSCDAMGEDLKKQCGLDRCQVLLTCSHTHTGPALRECLHCCWPYHDEKARALVEQYSLWLEKTIVKTVEQGFRQMEPVTLWATEGQADFAVNRRNNPEAEVPAIRRRGEPLKGPVDHGIPMLAVKAPSGKLLAVVLGYACHTTTLADTLWSGDYAGFAMIELEQRHPGAAAMFFQGCGADQNPLPRRTIELCRSYGGKLASGVEEALGKPMRPVSAKLQTLWETVDLPYARSFTTEELRERAKGGSSLALKARQYLKQVEAGKRLSDSYPYPVQVWKLGDDQLWISLAGEVCVDYSLKFKAAYGPQTWVNGFAQELVCYIPVRRIQREGFGQEVGSLAGYGLPAMEWTADVEHRVTAAVDRLVKKLK